MKKTGTFYIYIFWESTQRNGQYKTCPFAFVTVFNFSSSLKCLEGLCYFFPAMCNTQRDWFSGYKHFESRQSKNVEESQFKITTNRMKKKTCLLRYFMIVSPSDCANNTSNKRWTDKLVEDGQTFTHSHWCCFLTLPYVCVCVLYWIISRSGHLRVNTFHRKTRRPLYPFIQVSNCPTEKRKKPVLYTVMIEDNLSKKITGKAGYLHLIHSGCPNMHHHEICIYVPYFVCFENGR